MAFENLVGCKSFNIAATFAAKQFTFVKLDSTGKLASPSSGASAIGVIQDNPSVAGQPANVCGPGSETKIQAGGSFNPGDNVSTNSSGQAVASTTGAYVLGVAVTAGASGSLAVIVFQPRGSVAP